MSAKNDTKFYYRNLGTKLFGFSCKQAICCMVRVGLQPRSQGFLLTSGSCKSPVRRETLVTGLRGLKPVNERVTKPLERLRVRLLGSFSINDGNGNDNAIN